MRFEGIGRGNKNITIDHVGEEGVRQDITYTFFFNFLNFDSVEFILPATHTPLINVEQSAHNSWTEEACDLQVFFKDASHIQHTPKVESFIRSEF